MNTQLSEILQLSVAERIQLVEDIWDSIATVSEAVLSAVTRNPFAYTIIKVPKSDAP